MDFMGIESRKCVTTLVVLAHTLGIFGCASVPDEAVELSEAVGNDIEQFHQAYRQTVQASFAQMRLTGLTIIDVRWTPIYLQSFIVKGKLVEFAQQENTEAVEYWARAAVKSIDEKRREFLEPLQAKEEALLAQVDIAFGRTIQANATVTGYLGSIVKVKEFQDQMLDTAGLKDVRDELNAGIVDASNFAMNLTKEIEKQASELEENSN